MDRFGGGRRIVVAWQTLQIQHDWNQMAKRAYTLSSTLIAIVLIVDIARRENFLRYGRIGDNDRAIDGSIRAKKHSRPNSGLFYAVWGRAGTLV